ncbi:MAG: LuxR C-terminal-related transcriptional regulator [Mariprofundus sp.]|nr:LuxR C-terminal-related transcriptional regulator [Mariprofundus sp.]
MEQQRDQFVDLEKIQLHLSRYRGDLKLIHAYPADEHKRANHFNAESDNLSSVYDLLQDMHASVARDIAELERLLVRSGHHQTGHHQTGHQQAERQQSRSHQPAQNITATTCPFDTGSCDLNALSCKENEVLNMFAKGYSYNEVAVLLDCKLTTIQTHTKRIYKKLRVHSRSEAVYEARQMDIIVA